MTQFKDLTEQEQAALFASRERTRMHRGFELDIPRTHMIHGSGVMASVIPAASFRTRDSIATFKAAIRFTDTTPSGIIFSFGDATSAIALWVDNTNIYFRAGGATIDTNGNVASLPISPLAGSELTVIAMVRPDGMVGLWIPELRKRTWSNTGAFTAWASDVEGDFAQAAGAMPADVVSTGAPVNFDVIIPLSVYYGSFPRVNIEAELLPPPLPIVGYRYWRVLCQVSSNPGYYSMANLEMHESIGGADITTTGFAIAGDYFTETADKAFDADETLTYWNVTKTVPADGWVGQDFGAGNEKEIVEIEITARVTSVNFNQTPTQFIVQASNDLAVWDDVITVTGEPAWTSGAVRTYS